jgi:[acyl-carrier-protein] S-malonyltransferase
MAPAVEALAAAAEQVHATDPGLPLLSNLDGAVVRSGSDWLQRIVSQVSSPVRWDRCMATMASLGVTALIELPPAGTLAGLARRSLSGVRTLGLRTPDDLDAARLMLAEHADSDAPEWLAEDGDPVSAGQPLVRLQRDPRG